MDITEVRIKLMDDPHERLQAFCSITFDSCFVVRDLKIIQGTKGSFVAMPSRKLTDRCPRCYTKNHIRAMHCNQCGVLLDESRATKDTDGRAKLYADIAHPIKPECRELIQSSILEAYQLELVKAKEPNYSCRYDDYGEEEFATLKEESDLFETIEQTTAQKPTIIMQGEGDTTHRIEPAGPQPTIPHHAILPENNPSKQKQPATPIAPTQSATREDEGFGDGIV